MRVCMQECELKIDLQTQGTIWVSLWRSLLGLRIEPVGGGDTSGGVQLGLMLGQTAGCAFSGHAAGGAAALGRAHAGDHWLCETR